MFSRPSCCSLSSGSPSVSFYTPMSTLDPDQQDEWSATKIATFPQGSRGRARSPNCCRETEESLERSPREGTSATLEYGVKAIEVEKRSKFGREKIPRDDDEDLLRIVSKDSCRNELNSGVNDDDDDDDDDGKLLENLRKFVTTKSLRLQRVTKLIES